MPFAEHLLAWRVLSEDGLEGVFLAAIPPQDRHRFGPDLKTAISAAFASGRAAFSELPLPDHVFARHLARAATRMSDGAALSDLVAEDLYLACACLIGTPGAANAFISRHRPVIRRAIERMGPKANVDEIEQDVLAVLLVGSPARPPEVGCYAGRAPLARWVEVVAQRATLLWLRAERAQVTAAARASAEPPLGPDTPMEAVVFRERYVEAFEQSLKQVLRRAPEQDRAILRLQIVNNLSVEQIGKMLGVAQSTASRWLAKARDNVLVAVKANLNERLGIGSAEVQSLADLLLSRLDLTISQVLKADEPSASIRR
jgi:RNA polymerase sigma-70 factor (ECF subfamily)